MTVQAISRPTIRRRTSRAAMLPLVVLLLLALAAAAFIVYALWPSWQKIAEPLEVPSMPITVAGVRFDVPPAAIRNPVQRQPGSQERLDLAFPAPRLTLSAAAKVAESTNRTSQDASDPAADASDALFVTITELGSLMPPDERLRTIYPHYVDPQAQAGPKGLTVLPFRAGSPYDGEDLIYPAADPAKFFARCTRQVGAMPGTCIHERTIGGADITLRFPRAWLADWQDLDAAINRLIPKLHPN